MYLHLGSDISVSLDSVVAIMDLDNTSTSGITQEYLKNINQRKELYINEGKEYFDGNIYVPDDLEIIDIK